LLAALARVAVVGLSCLAAVGSVWAPVDAPAATPIYGACITTAECVRIVDECVHGALASGAETEFGICTIDCATDVDCVDGGTCIELEPGRLTCAARCTVAADCGEETLGCSAGRCVPTR
jgi:hypothetical protein